MKLQNDYKSVAKLFHEYMRTYGSLQNEHKPLLASALLLAVQEMKRESLSLDYFNDKNNAFSNKKLLEVIDVNLMNDSNLTRKQCDSVLNQFQSVITNKKINTFDARLQSTPLAFFLAFLYNKFANAIGNTHLAEDYIGEFYREFMSYAGGDGQDLGIVLTPYRVTKLMSRILNVQPTDRVLDPCCGTGGFLSSALHYTSNPSKTGQQPFLCGIELKENMSALSVSNMILNNAKKYNILNADFFNIPLDDLKKQNCNVGYLNPPFSLGKVNKNQYEIYFIEKLLDALAEGGRAAVLVPQSTMTGKTQKELQAKRHILEKHTLESVITLHPNTFYHVGTMPVIAVFTTHIPHEIDHICRFIDFREDGYEIQRHTGLVDTGTAEAKYQEFMDIWTGKILEHEKCINMMVTAEDEWLYNYFYCNTQIPSDADFEETIGEYLTFQFSMIMQHKEYLFKGEANNEIT